MYIVLEGQVQVYRGVTVSGTPRELEKLEGPLIIGEAALLHTAFRTHSIYSLTKLKLCSINRANFKELVKFVCP